MSHLDWILIAVANGLANGLHVLQHSLVDGAWLSVAGECEEELAVFPPAGKLGDSANARQGHLLLLLARGQAVNLQPGCCICQVAHHQSIPLQDIGFAIYMAVIGMQCKAL